MTLTDGYIVIGVAYTLMSAWQMIKKDKRTEAEKNRFRDLIKSVPENMMIAASFCMTLAVLLFISSTVIGWPVWASYDAYRHFKYKNKPS